jgi:hypothetical protein
MHINSWVSRALVQSYSFVVRDHFLRVLDRAAVGEVGGSPGCARDVWRRCRPMPAAIAVFSKLSSARSLLASPSNRSTMERFSSPMSSFSIAPRSRDFRPALERWTKWVLGWFLRLSFQF